MDLDYLKHSLKNTRYLCPNCKTNSHLFETKVYSSAKILFWRITRHLEEQYISCESCNKKMHSKDLEIKSLTPKNYPFGVVKTHTFETKMVKNHVFTTTTRKIDYSNYVPDLKNKQLYFETIILLMNFIQQNDKSIDITKNKFYILALENSDPIIEFTADELENRIFENADQCFIEFTDAELGYLVRNSINVLKGKFAINSNITNLYYKLFDLFKFRTITHEVYFYCLLEQ